ncbi:MAG: hypothetical protein QXT77_09610 [Candidatus Methanomethylicaceae archaeon]
MAGAVGAAARGAMEAGERGGWQPQADLAGTQGVEGGRGEMRGMGPCGFSQGEGGGRGATAVGSRGEGLIAGRVAPYPSSFECPAKLCL